MNDFNTILDILKRANIKFEIMELEGEHSSIDCPSPYPDNYDTGVTFTFNDDGSLYSVHSFEPEPEDE